MVNSGVRSGDCRGSLIQALLQVEGGTNGVEGRSVKPSSSSPASTPTTTTSGDQKSRYDDKTTSPKAFVCPECGKQFNAHYNLTRHMPVHTGARPFVCKVLYSSYSSFPSKFVPATLL